MLTVLVERASCSLSLASWHCGYILSVKGPLQLWLELELYHCHPSIGGIQWPDQSQGCGSLRVIFGDKLPQSTVKDSIKIPAMLPSSRAHAQGNSLMVSLYPESHQENTVDSRGQPAWYVEGLWLLTCVLPRKPLGDAEMLRNTWNHDRLEKAGKTLHLDLELLTPGCERIPFCCCKPLSLGNSPRKQIHPHIHSGQSELTCLACECLRPLKASQGLLWWLL